MYASSPLIWNWKNAQDIRKDCQICRNSERVWNGDFDDLAFALSLTLLCDKVLASYFIHLLYNWTLLELLPIVHQPNIHLTQPNIFACSWYHPILIVVDRPCSFSIIKSFLALPIFLGYLYPLQCIGDGVIKALAPLESHWMRSVTRERDAAFAVLPAVARGLRFPMVQFAIPHRGTVIRHPFENALEWVRKLLG